MMPATTFLHAPTYFLPQAAEIKELKVTRVERLQSAALENGRAPYMKSNSYS